MRKNLRSSLAILAVVSVAALSGGCFLFRPPGAVVATVNGENVYKPDLDRALAATEQQFGSVFKGKDGDKLRRQFESRLLDGLVTQRVLLQEAKKQGIQVSDKRVDDEIKTFVQQSGGEKKFDDQIKKLKLTRSQVKEEIRTALILRQLQERFFKGSKVSQADVQKYYDANKKQQFSEPEQISARHILVKTKAKADEVLRKLKGGGKFEVLAKQYSQDTSNKDNGGDLGYFARGTMVPEFDKVAFKLKKGQVSDPVKTEFGFHVIRLDANKPAQVKPLAQVKSEIEDELKRQKFGEYVQVLRKKATVKKLPPYDKAVTADAGANQGATADQGGK